MLAASSQHLRNAMAKAAEKKGVEAIIDVANTDAICSGKFSIEGYDVLLLAPQTRGYQKYIAPICKKHNVPFINIDGFTFAIADGEAGYKKYIEPYLREE